MAKFAAASDALIAALAIVDARLTNIEENEQLELYLQLIERRASIQEAIAASGGGGGGDASAANQTTQITAANLTNTRVGDLVETAPANDTASSGLNGRLQRIAQRLTSLLSLFPASLGAKTAANSLAVTLSTDGVASGIATQVGEVQTTPTANTVLARLKAIADVTALSVNQIPAFTNSPVNFGSANQAVLKASAGTVYRLYCYNKNASTRFFQIHNKATAPVNTDVPVTSFPVASNTALVIDITFWGASGRACSTGIAWAFSSTEATLTLATAADQTSAVGYL